MGRRTSSCPQARNRRHRRGRTGRDLGIRAACAELSEFAGTATRRFGPRDSARACAATNVIDRASAREDKATGNKPFLSAGIGVDATPRAGSAGLVVRYTARSAQRELDED